MKKILSALLILTTVFSTLPPVVFAENKVIEAHVAENTALEDDYGMEANATDGLYYMEGESLFYSENNKRPTLLVNKCSWVIESEGEAYYSSPEGNNTCILKGKQKEEITKIFCPVSCFDIEGGYIYYSYNNEIFKINIESSEEELVCSGVNFSLFFVEDGNVMALENTDDGIPVEEELLGGASLMAGEPLYEGQCSIDDLTFISNATRKEYMENMLCYYIENDTNIDADLQNGKFALFFFEGGSDNMDKSAYYSNYDLYRMFGVCMVVQRIDGSDYVICANENCTTICDRPTDTSYGKKYSGWASGTAKDGTYESYITNHNGEYSGLSVRMTSNDYNLPAIYNTTSGVNDSWAQGINVHSRWGEQRSPYGANWQWSEGCLLVGSEIGTEYNRFIEIISPASCTKQKVNHKSKRQVYKYTSGSDTYFGRVTIDRQLFKSELGTLFNSSDVAANITAVSTAASEAAKEYISKKLDTSSKDIYELKEDVDPEEVKDKIEKRDEPSFWAKVVGVIEDVWNWFVGLFSTDSTSTIAVLGTVHNDEGDWYLLGDNTYVIKSQIDKYYKRSYKGVNSNISFYSMGAPSGSITKGPYSVSGTISSNCNIKTITAKVIDTASGNVVLTHSVNPRTKQYSIKGSALDKGIKFGNLSVGRSYYLRYEVTDDTWNQGLWKSATFTVTQGVQSYAPMPTVSVSGIENGQRATVVCSDSGALIHVKTNSGEKTGYGSVVIDFTTPGSYSVEAWTTKSGYTASARAVKSVSVIKLPTPVISDATFGKDAATVTISGSGDVYYTTDSSAPTKSSTKYNGPIKLTETKTIKAVSIQHGCVNSDTASRNILVTPPDAPVIKLTSKDKLAQGKTASVSWNSAPRATEYTAYMYKDGEVVKTVKTTGTNASFSLDDKSDTKNFTYTIKVVASNFKGESPLSNGAVVMGMHPVTVTFVDRINTEGELTEEKLAEIKTKLDNKFGEGSGARLEGQILSKQKVEYDTKPKKPSTPSKTGFKFAGWSEGLYETATQNKTIYAEFDINYYVVSFYDIKDFSERGEILLSDEFMYAETVTPPENYQVPENYIFGGWNVDSAHSTGYDYNFVDGNIVLEASYAWKNEELPVFLKINSIIRDDKSYRVNWSMKNNPVKDTQGRVIIALYTNSGRCVYTQIVDKDFDLGKLRDWTELDEITLLCKERISCAKAYMVAVVNNKTAGALSEETTYTNITYDPLSNFWTDWSDWQDEPIEASDTVQVETKKQYRYHDKTFTTSNKTKNLGDGWIYLKPEPIVGEWVSTGTTKPIASSSDEKTREVPEGEEHIKYKTQYLYSRAYGWHPKGYYIAYGWKSGDCQTVEGTGWLDSPLPHEANHSCGKAYGRGYPNENGVSRDIYWYNETTQKVEDYRYYTYKYRDIYYTHHFWKWLPYSDWSDKAPANAANRETETKIQYRMRTLSENANDSELPDVYKKTIKGKLLAAGSEYVTEDEYNSKKYELIEGPLYKDDDGEYIPVSDAVKEVKLYRYARYTNGTYIMPCKEAAEELFGGEWKKEYSEWSEEEAQIIGEGVYSCDNEEHNHETTLWDEYEVNGENYCIKEEKTEIRDITFTDTTKYYHVKTSLEGEKATVLVYKRTNTDPTEEQLEFADQIEIGEENSYEIELNSREKLDYELTGDFVVTLALEGGLRLVNVDYIKADVPEYTVNFYANGALCESVKVELGSGVDLNTIQEPQSVGEHFVKWDKSVVDITGDTSINAVFEKDLYTVAFVDHENKTTELKQMYHNDPIPAPQISEIEGKRFVGWDSMFISEEKAGEGLYNVEEEIYIKLASDRYIKESEFDENIHTRIDDVNYYKLPDGEVMYIKEPCIITAVWESKVYDVIFCDFDGTPVSSQRVEHGNAAEMPDFITKDSVTYIWDITGAEWWNVTENMYIYPYKNIVGDVQMPGMEASLLDAGGSFYAELSAEENNSIYYTICAEITQIEAQKYLERKANEELIGVEAQEVMLPEENDETESEAEATPDRLQEPDPVNYIKEYTEPIEITEGSVIYAFAVNQEGYISPVAVFEYGRDTSVDEGIIENTYEIDPEDPAILIENANVKPGETVTVPVTIVNNPGIDNLSIVFGYDSENLTLVEAKNADVFEDFEYSADTRADGSCKFTWNSQNPVKKDGTLLMLTFKAGENEMKTKLDITLEESQSGGQEQPFVTNSANIINGNIKKLTGDVNSDGQITYTDAIFILRYDIGMITLTEQQIERADVNADGEVDFADAIKVLRFDAGLIDSL